MKRSGDPGIAAIARDRSTGISGDASKKFTTEARRRGGDCRNGGFSDHPITCDLPIPRSFSASPCLRGEISFQITRSPDLPITRDGGDPPIHRSLNIRPRIHNGWRLVTATLREIFDENAYDRFLLRTQTSRSVESYREFMREREAAAARRPRCC